MPALKIVELTAGHRSHESWAFEATRKIVEGFSYEFQPGVVYGLLGRNGSGKSTLLRSIVDPASRLTGSVSVEGQPLLAGQVAFVPQNPAVTLCPWQTIEREVGLPLYVRGIPRAEITDRILCQLQTLGLELPLQRPVSTLSGGQKMLIAIARALCVPNPKAFVLDEPFEGLDVHVRSKVVSVIRALAVTKSIPVLVTSHRREDLIQIGAKLCSLKGSPISALVAHDTTSSVLTPLGGTVDDTEPQQNLAEDSYESATDEAVGLSGRRRLAAMIEAAAGFAIGIVIWWVAALIVNNESLLPYPHKVGVELLRLVGAGDQRRDVAATFGRIVAAWVIGNVIAIPIGIVIGYHSQIFRLASPWLSLGRSIPIFALIGVAAGLFPRLPEIQRMFLVILMVAAFSAQATAAAAALVPRMRLWLSRVYGATGWYQITRIMPFEIRPALFSTLEVSLPLAIVIVFVIELFLIPHDGLGKYLYNHFNDRDLSRLFACVMLPGFVAVAVVPIIRWAGRHSLRRDV